MPRGTSNSDALGRRERGTSLVEVLIAFLVFALGMVALGRTQGLQRAGLELSRQRADAARIAQQQLEIARGVQPWNALADAMLPVDAVPGMTAIRQVNALPSLQNAKAVAITVRWTDRSGMPQHFTLSSILDGTDPVLTGAVALGAAGTWAAPVATAAAGSSGVPVSPGTSTTSGSSGMSTASTSALAGGPSAVPAAPASAASATLAAPAA